MRILDDPTYYLERLEATHFFIFVTVPDEYGDDPKWHDTECTWWDFSCILAKKVGDDWYGWSEDPGDVGNIWYQTTYRKAEAYGVRDLCVSVASAGELYNELTEADFYLTSKFSDRVKAEVMTWW